MTQAPVPPFVKSDHSAYFAGLDHGIRMDPGTADGQRLLATFLADANVGRKRCRTDEQGRRPGDAGRDPTVAGPALCIPALPRNDQQAHPRGIRINASTPLRSRHTHCDPGLAETLIRHETEVL